MTRMAFNTFCYTLFSTLTPLKGSENPAAQSLQIGDVIHREKKQFIPFAYLSQFNV